MSLKCEIFGSSGFLGDIVGSLDSVKMDTVQADVVIRVSPTTLKKVKQLVN